MSENKWFVFNVGMGMIIVPLVILVGSGLIFVHSMKTIGNHVRVERLK